MDNNELNERLADINKNVNSISDKLKSLKESRINISKSIDGLKGGLNSLRESKKDIEQAENDFNKSSPSE